MVRNPRVLKKAQAEIDVVVGNDRLPSLSDRNDLPYIGAILKESLRFYPVLPMGMYPSIVNRVPLTKGRA